MQTLRFVIALAIFMIIIRLCWGEYSEFRSLSDIPIAHVSSINGFENNAEVKIDVRDLTGKLVVLVPTQNDALNQTIGLWRPAKSLSQGSLFPVLVCMQAPCVVSAGDIPPRTEMAILDHLAYGPALAVLRASVRHQILVIDDHHRIRLTSNLPENPEDIQKLVAMCRGLNGKD